MSCGGNPRDISSVTQLVVGGSAMPRGLIEAYERDFGVNVVHAWGMTEMSPIGSVAKLQTQASGPGCPRRPLGHQS